MAKAWKMKDMEYCAYEEAICSAKTDEEALKRCKLIKTEQPDWNPDYYSSNTWGPLHLSVGRRWAKTTRWLLPFCNPECSDDWNNNVFQYCYGCGNAPGSLGEPSLAMAKILVEEGEREPRVFVKTAKGTIPLYKYGAYLYDVIIGPFPEYLELDTYFKWQSFEFQKKTGKGVDGFPILHASDLTAA